MFRLSFEKALGHAVGPVPVGIFLENLLDFSLNSLDRLERGLYDRFGWRSIKEEAPLAANTAASGRRVPSTPLRIGKTRGNGFAENDSGMLGVGTGAGALPGVGGAVSSRAGEGAVRAPVHEAGAFQGRGVRYSQDSRGFMWFALEGVLNRYDGISFRVYEPDPENENSISAGAVNVLFEDSRNRLWIGTRKGLNRFDPETETFKRYPHDLDAPRQYQFRSRLLRDLRRPRRLPAGGRE